MSLAPVAFKSPTELLPVYSLMKILSGSSTAYLTSPIRNSRRLCASAFSSTLRLKAHLTRALWLLVNNAFTRLQYCSLSYSVILRERSAFRAVERGSRNLAVKQSTHPHIFLYILISLFLITRVGYYANANTEGYSSPQRGFYFFFFRTHTYIFVARDHITERSSKFNQSINSSVSLEATTTCPYFSQIETVNKKRYVSARRHDVHVGKKQSNFI